MKRLLLCSRAAGNFHLESAMNLSINPAACVSCGMCAERLPAVFRNDRTARSAVLLRQPQPAEQDDALEAAEDCPAGAIISSFFMPNL